MVDLVAERDGEVVGWVCHGPYRADGTGNEDGGAGAGAGDAEVYAIHVDPGHFSRGVGRAPHRVAAPVRRRRVRTDAAVGAEGEPPRPGLLRALGFSPDGAEESFEVAGVPVPEALRAGPVTSCCDLAL
ncbi:GNAT family N-acetyltransferase [Streptomyces sp. CRN 30]|uniref:GNAT family N-acetyltransferase n=1 Tax=Streptomyces sp. CRN 30 TaxID=3075613 RepID=UPI0039C4739A